MSKYQPDWNELLKWKQEEWEKDPEMKKILDKLRDIDILVKKDRSRSSSDKEKNDGVKK